MLVLCLLATGLSGCGALPGLSSGIQDDDIVAEVDKAAKRLMKDSDLRARGDTRLIVTSLADVDALGQSSRFGRMVGQHLATAITDRGYNVVELLLSDTIYIDKAQGEFVLTRDVGTLARDFDADAVVVGTYAVAQDRVYVTTKVVRAEDARILSGHTFELMLGPNTRGLVRN